MAIVVLSVSDVLVELILYVTTSKVKGFQGRLRRDMDFQGGVDKHTRSA